MGGGDENERWEMEGVRGDGERRKGGKKGMRGRRMG